MRKLTLLFSLVLSLSLAGQSTRDSLIDVINTTEDDVERLNTKFKLASLYNLTDPRASIAELDECLVMAVAMDDSLTIARIYQGYGVAYDYLSEFSKARTYFKRALNIAQNHEFNTLHGRVLNSLGVIDLREGKYESALEYYLAALQIAEAEGDTDKVVYFMNNAGHVFYYQSQYEKALEYYEKGLKKARELKNPEFIAECLQHTALIKFNLGMKKEALQDYYAALEHFRQDKGKQMQEANVLQNLGVMFKQTGEMEHSRAYYDSSLVLFEELGNLEGQAQSFVNIGELLLAQEKYAEAEKLLKRALHISEEIGIKEGVKYSANALSDVYKATGNYEKALEYFQLYTAVSDSLLSEQSTSRIAELEASYDKAQKEQEILQLQADQSDLDARLAKETAEKKQWTFGLSIALLVVIFGTATVFMRYENRRLKREKQRQLNFSQQLIEWQEQERKRIAGDLHDGVGQSLIMLKNKVQKLRDGAGTDEEAIFGSLENGISNTIQEIRGMSYSLRPFQLDFLGLQRAIEEMIEDVQSHTDIKISTYIDEVDNVFEQEEEVSIFRIVQECLNNLIKHSQATKSTIHMAMGDKTLNIRVTDDGVGFDPAFVFNSKEGFGLKGAKERVKLMGGNLNIETGESGGTRILINLPIRKRKA